MDTQWGKEFCKLVLGNMTEADIEYSEIWFSFLKLTCGKEAETGDRVWHNLYQPPYSGLELPGPRMAEDVKCNAMM